MFAVDNKEDTVIADIEEIDFKTCVLVKRNIRDQAHDVLFQIRN